MPGRRPFWRLRLILVLVGIGCLGIYGYTLADEHVYQAYENWAFDRQIAGQTNVSAVEYLREKTPFSFLLGERPTPIVQSAPDRPLVSGSPKQGAAEGDLLGRVSIGRLNIAAVVREGVSDRTLALAVGHVPSTALPGQPGNFAIAAHRDTLFRALKDIRTRDVVTVESLSGSFRYEVLATKIVKPSDVSVLRFDGGGLIPSPPVSSGQNPQSLLTLITCYPFRYIGSAPKRFIVEARLVSADENARRQSEERKQAAAVTSQAVSSGKQVARLSRSRPPGAGSRRSYHATATGFSGPYPRASARKPARKRNWVVRFFLGL